MESQLTEKQKQFCLEYFKNGYNATKAYKTVYPDAKDDNVAGAAGNRLLRNVKIIEHLNDLKERKEEAAEISWLLIANEFRSIALDKNAELRDRIKALENINKMIGYNAPEKTESELNIKNPIIKVGYGISNE